METEREREREKERKNKTQFRSLPPSLSCWTLPFTFNIDDGDAIFDRHKQQPFLVTIRFSMLRPCSKARRHVFLFTTWTYMRKTSRLSHPNYSVRYSLFGQIFRTMRNVCFFCPLLPLSYSARLTRYIFDVLAIPLWVICSVWNWGLELET